MLFHCMFWTKTFLKSNLLWKGKDSKDSDKKMKELDNDARKYTNDVNIMLMILCSFWHILKKSKRFKTHYISRKFI